jgi:hypothetical protein
LESTNSKASWIKRFWAKGEPRGQLPLGPLGVSSAGKDEMKMSRTIAEVVTAVLIFLLALPSSAQEKKEFSYTVGRRAVISITNNYGLISVGPSGNKRVLVTTVSHSATVSFANKQRGGHIELHASSSRQGTDLADYHVLVPSGP